MKSTLTTTPAIDMSRDLCTNLSVASRREWLVTNGIGGFAAGTVSNILTRRYQGTLIAALNPPLGRTLLVSKFEESAQYAGRDFALSANQWSSGVTAPMGHIHIDRFYLDGAIPVWEFTIADAALEKRIWMRQGENTTYVRYQLLRASMPLQLQIKTLVNYRDYHASTHAGDWQMRIDRVEHGLCVHAFAGAIPFYLLSDHAEAAPRHEWYRNFQLAVEAYRELEANEDNLLAGDFSAELQRGEAITLVASTLATAGLDGEAMLEERRAYERGLWQGTTTKSKGDTGKGVRREPSRTGKRESEIDEAQAAAIRQLVLAADQFLVSRPSPDEPKGRSLIAGYPWFGDWGRDTMIALPGLTLTTGRTAEAASILRTFARFVDRGMLPNRFPDAGEQPEYNTADATLWYFEAMRAYHAATADDALVAQLFPVLQEIIEWHQRGTRYQIQVDAKDGLLYAGEAGVQLTWMDAKIGDWVVTPRIGKAVELNALWYNALRSMADFARLPALQLDPSTHSSYAKMADHTRLGFQRFWNGDLGCCFDVLDTPNYNHDSSLRPNQLFAVSLPHSPLEVNQQQAIVDLCARHLLTPHGLRSLAPSDPAYVSTYGGTPLQRDAAYHQGTVWAWLIGPFVSAHLRVYKNPQMARSYLLPLLRHLSDHGIGSISEIFDGDAPWTPRGCYAQAWSVAEVLRTWKETAEW